MIARLAWLALAGAGVTALACEWVLPRPRIALAYRDAPHAVARLAAPRPRAASAADAAVVLARPLFALSRRPAVDTARSRSWSTAPPRLAGIIVAQNYRRAVFERPGHVPVTVGEADIVGAWHIVRISMESVTVSNEQESLQLSPTFLYASMVTPKRDPWVTPAATGLLRARWANPQLQP